jgi:hypothetical protein
LRVARKRPGWVEPVAWLAAGRNSERHTARGTGKKVYPTDERNKLVLVRITKSLLVEFRKLLRCARSVHNYYRRILNTH